MPAPPRHQDLFEQHRAALVAYAAALTRDRTVAEDIVQEAWIRLDQAEAFQSADRPEAYLYRIVRNLALDRIRRGRFELKHFSADEASALRATSPEPDPETAATAREALRKTLATLQSLPPRMRTAVEMHRLEGARLKDIAARLGVSVTVAHELVAEGVERCRRALRQKD